jgi:DNA-binding transcriptional ArsR family regulator
MTDESSGPGGRHDAPPSAPAQAPEGLLIGSDRQAGGAAGLHLAPRTLLRHMMALGSSGSGKTVLCKAVTEEAVRHGIPAICLDPQGDLCSLALAAGDPDRLAEKGVDPDLARAFAQRAEVVVFTPGSRKGVALSADPVHADLAGLGRRERIHAVSGIAQMVVALLGYDLGSDDGEGLAAVFDRALTELHGAARFPRNLQAFADYLLGLDAEGLEPYARYIDARKIDQARKRLARLDVGARHLLFHDGLPLDMDLLLGRGDAAPPPGKTRLSVIYLNTLHGQEDKEFFVAALTERLYAWMLKHPSDAPQALFYIDEVAPFVPPVRKPACKPSLMLLFKQARKYGVCCLMATQNPADVDYKAMAQFGTWALGRLTTRQDLKKVQPTVKSLDPGHVDQVMEELPAQRPGEFLLISPDNFAGNRRLQARWLYTQHRTWDEEQIEDYTDAHTRAVFEALEARWEGDATESSGDEEAAEHSLDTGRVNSASPAAPAPVPAAAAPPAQPEPEPAIPPELAAHAECLAASPSMTSRELAKRAKVSQSSARRILKRLEDEGLAQRFRDGRSVRYFARATGLRPDLGLAAPVRAVEPLLDEAEAVRIGAAFRSSRLLGLIGADEHLERVVLEHRVLLRLTFRERVKRGFLRRLLGGGSHEERLESVYLHPRSLDILVFHPQDGMSFESRPEEHASEVEDLDGVARFVSVAPGSLRFDEHEWTERASDDRVRERFRSVYAGVPKAVEPVFVPVWRLHFRASGRPGLRVVTIDALSGHEVEW